jgi:hypothetical protein
VGALLTGTGLWLLAGLASPIPTPAALAVLTGGFVILLLRDFGVVRFWLPENHRQVPQTVLHLPGLWPAFRFGVELGTGVRTYVPAVAPYLLALALLLFGEDWRTVGAAALGFAAGRTTMPAVRLLSGDEEAWDGLLAHRHALLVRTCGTVTALAIGLLVLLHPAPAG